MLDDVAAAFDRQDYKTAARLLKDLVKQSPQNPWVQLYVGRLQEVSGKLAESETIYRRLLRQTTNPKLVAQARQGIQRLETIQRQHRQAAIAQATADPTNAEPGFLVLEAVTGEARMAAAQNFAKVMKLDAYTARLLLPNRGWRLYRAGAIGELQVYGQELKQAGIPAFWASLTQLQQIQVFQVCYIKSAAPKATIVCLNPQAQLGSLEFDWSEVSQRVEGMLPIFEQVLNLGYRDRPERKEATQDYTHFCDLHLPKRGCILRLHEAQYDFHQGVSVIPQQAPVDELDRHTLRTNWNALLDMLDRCLPQTPVWSEFTTFAETTTDFTGPLGRLKPHIPIPRDQDTFWDAAFELYSGLIFLHSTVGS